MIVSSSSETAAVDGKQALLKTSLMRIQESRRFYLFCLVQAPAHSDPAWATLLRKLRAAAARMTDLREEELIEELFAVASEDASAVPDVPEIRAAWVIVAAVASIIFEQTVKQKPPLECLQQTARGAFRAAMLLGAWAEQTDGDDAFVSVR